MSVSEGWLYMGRSLIGANLASAMCDFLARFWKQVNTIRDRKYSENDSCSFENTALSLKGTVIERKIDLFVSPTEG